LFTRIISFSVTIWLLISAVDGSNPISVEQYNYVLQKHFKQFINTIKPLS